MAQPLPARGEVPASATCDLASVFADPAAWEAELERVAAALPGLERFRGRLAEGSALLADWLETSEGLQRSLGRLVVYAGMGHAVDTGDAQAAARSDRARTLAARLGAACAFAEPELAALGAEGLRAWVAAEPRLAHHAHHFEQILRHAAHLRSAEVEQLLRGLADPFRTAAAIHGTLTDADLTFADAVGAEAGALQVAQGTIGALLAHPEPEVRRTAWESYADAHLAHRHSCAACLAAGVKQNVFLARARGYGSALEAALTPNDIPVEVFHHLLRAFRRHLPTWHRYWRLLRRTLGVGSLRVCDLKAPLGAHPPRVPFAEAVEWIAAGTAPLGPEYVAALRRGVLAERWVDHGPNRGKRAGAFSGGAPGTRPFILMTYTPDLGGLSTLAHELGHSLHSLYTRESQPQTYSGYSIFVAEVASNFNQALVRAHLWAQAPDREFRLAVLEEAMANLHRYLFLMPTLARFELEMHERVERGQALTASVLDGLLADLFAEGYGGEVEVDRERVGITWAQFPTHLYSNFYVYQYATGIAGAHVLAEGVLEGHPGAAARYLDFLRCGSSRYPLDALRLAGVDLTSPEVLERGFAVLASTVERLEGLLAPGPDRPEPGRA